MKRILAIAATIALCFVLTVPAFAVDDDSITLPESDASFTFICSAPGYTMAMVVPDGYNVPFSTGFNSDNLPILHFDKLRIYVMDSNGEWKLSGNASDLDDVIYLSGVDILYCSHTIYDASGNIYISSTVPETETGVSDNVLSSVVPAESLSGSLVEVISLLAIALPIVAGLIGIRKGVAFLLSRVRGV